MPFCNKYLRLPDKGIETLPEKASQSLRPDSHNLCSVMAPMHLDMQECVLEHKWIYNRFSL